MSTNGSDHHAGLPAEPNRPRPDAQAPLPAGSSGHWPSAAARGELIRPAPAPDPWALLKAFRRRWPVAIGLGLVAAAAAVAVAWLVVPPAKYTATATIRILSHRPSLMFLTKEQQADFRTFQQTQVQLLKSNLVLDKAVAGSAISQLPVIRAQDEPAAWLKNEIKASYAPMSELIELSLSGDNPQDTADILGAVIDAYIKYVVNREAEDRLRRLQFLEKTMRDYEDELKTKRANLREMAEQAGAIDKDQLALRTEFVFDNLYKHQNLLTQTESQILQAEADISVHEAQQPPPPPPAAPGQQPDDRLPATVADSDAELRALEADAGKVARLLEDAQHAARKLNDPAVVRFRGQLDKLKAQIKARRMLLLSQAADRGLDPAQGPRSLVEENLLAARLRLQKLNLFRAALKEKIKGYQEEAKNHNNNAIDLHTVGTRVLIADSTAKEVGREIENLKVELQAPSRVDVIDLPKTPRTKDEMKKLRLVGLAGVGAFGLSVLGITFLELRARRIGSPEEVERQLGLRLVGSLPALPGRNGRTPARRADADRWRSRLIESIDATRTMLLHASRTEAMRVFMITSATKGEGKTSLASHLATSLARAGRKTLLIDCDLRRPALHKLFDVPAEPGMCELLRGELDPAAATHPTPAGDLDVLTAGRCDPVALQMLAQDAARGIFNTLAADYDFIIVDSSPILPVADGLLLGQQVDAVLFALLHEVSCAPQVQLAYERLASLNVRILGAVVNGAAGTTYGYDGYSVYEQPVARA